jgi:hypothetical protein
MALTSKNTRSAGGTLTIASWLWVQPEGRTRYTAEHVWIWADMVSRNLAMPHRLICVTTETDLPPNVERIDPPGEFEDVHADDGARVEAELLTVGWSCSSADAAKTFGKRFVSIDLDCIVGGPLDPLFDATRRLRDLQGHGFKSRPYNEASMMLLTAGARTQVYEQIRPGWRGCLAGAEAFSWLRSGMAGSRSGARMKRHGSEADGVWHLNRYMQRVRKAHPTVLFFPGKRKPWELAPIFPFMRDNYRILAREAA